MYCKTCVKQTPLPSSLEFEQAIKEPKSWGGAMANMTQRRRILDGKLVPSTETHHVAMVRVCDITDTLTLYQCPECKILDSYDALADY